MASNFDFLKSIDKELFELIEEAQRLYRSGYFNQTVIQVRIYAEKMAKKILNPTDSTMTFDNVLNCLKDKVKDERERELIDDLFFIKKSGNACAHGEDITPMNALEVIKSAFEAGINYAYFKKNDEKIDKLRFDETLFVTEKSQKENKIVDKYIELAQKEIDEKTAQENLLKEKQGEFLKSANDEKRENSRNIKNINSKNPKNPKKEEFKRKQKEAKKNLANNINKTAKKSAKNPKPAKSKPQKPRQKAKDENINLKKYVAFFLFLTVSLILLIKMIF